MFFLLLQLGLQVNGSSNSENCINEIVPMSMILEDKEFMDYITESNNTLGKNKAAKLIVVIYYYVFSFSQIPFLFF